MALVISDPRVWWPNGKVYYDIQSLGALPANLIGVAMQSILAWSNETKFSFYPGTVLTHRRILKFHRHDADWFCQANINPRGSNVYCSIEDLMTWIHEIGHALGFFHEQQRADRDEHVNYFPNQVINDRHSNFEIRNDATAVGPYDARSLMHYRATTLSKHGNKTLTSKVRGISDDDLGSNEGISNSEILGAAFLVPYYQVKIRRVVCIHTEDHIGDDDTTVTFRADGRKVHDFRHDFEDVSQKTLNRTFKFKDKLTLSFLEHDWPDDDDRMGSITITKPITQTYDLRYRRAWYQVDVEPDMSPYETTALET